MGRDRRFQAILPIRGKILNVEKARLEKILQSEQVGIMISALGCGVGSEAFNLEKLRYHKIIIMTDADVDGSHIRTLLLTFFYRHMPQLIESNFIYIAQPPLYRVTRKKISRYIHSEREMDDYLLELGTSDVHVRLSASDQTLPKVELLSLIELIHEIEALINRVERKGIPFREFLASKNDENLLPRYQITLSDGPLFVYSAQEFEAFKKKDEEAQRKSFEETLASIPPEELTEEAKTFRPTKLHIVELYEEEDLQKIDAGLKKFGVTLSNYHIAEKHLLDLIDDQGQVTACYTLKETMDFLRENGRKGMEIQRYKGLGEMNADQLWETTMDPAKRTLTMVTLPDAIAADHMFTMLMGEDVPPRRAFIEQHALSVKNLDI
jgi:DNA gyrase subunit B